MAVNTNINIPQSPFLDTTTGRPAREWLVWLQYPQVVSINLANALPISSGGTGSQAIPTNGQTLIGNGSVYVAANLTPDIGIGITNGPGTITIKNTGVTSFSSGSTGLTPANQANGDVVLAGTLQVGSGGTGINAVAAGNLLYGNTASQLAYDTDLYWSSSLKDLQVVTIAANQKRSFTAISSTAGMSMGVDAANNGFLYSLTTQVFYTGGFEKMRLNAAGALAFGGSTLFGTSGQLLMSKGNAASPIWQQSLYFDTTTTTLQNVTLTSGTYQSFAVVNPGALTAMGVDAYNNSFINAQNDLFIGTNSTARLRITSGGAFYWNGTLGASGTFTAGGQTVTVSYGIITSIV